MNQPVLRCPSISLRWKQRIVARGAAVLVWLSVAGGLLGWGCSDDDADDDANDEFAAFDEAISSFLDEQGLEGAGAVVVDRDAGELHARGYGAFDAERLYLIASSSKILSVGILMRLADQGLVDFDEPIGTYLSEEFGEGKAELTLAQLLSNSSGLISLADNPTYAP